MIIVVYNLMFRYFLLLVSSILNLNHRTTAITQDFVTNRRRYPLQVSHFPAQIKDAYQLSDIQNSSSVCPILDRCLFSLYRHQCSIWGNYIIIDNFCFSLNRALTILSRRTQAYRNFDWCTMNVKCSNWLQVDSAQVSNLEFFESASNADHDVPCTHVIRLVRNPILTFF